MRGWLWRCGSWTRITGRCEQEYSAPHGLMCLQIVFMDAHDASELDEVWQLLAPNHPVVPLAKLVQTHGGGPLCFAEMHIANPGYYSVLQPGRGRGCTTSSLIDKFRRFIWGEFGISDPHAFYTGDHTQYFMKQRDESNLVGDAKPSYLRPTITFPLRRPYSPHPRSNGKNRRKLENEDEGTGASNVNMPP